MKNKFGMIAALFLIGLAAVSTAEVSITTAVGSGADGGVSNDSNQGPSVLLGTATNVNLRRYDGTRAKAVLLRFDISSLGDNYFDGAILSITTSSTSNRARTVNVYGLLDGDDDLWSESNLCYNTAPGLLAASLGYITIDTAKWSQVGTINFAAGPALNSGAINLSDMIAADTNGLISLLLYTSTSDSSQSWYCAMKEYYPTYPSPTLTFPNALPRGASYPSPADGETLIDLSSIQVCWKNWQIDRAVVWFGAADANEANYQSLLSPLTAIDNPDEEECVSVGTLTAPQTYSWVVEGWVYPESDPEHLGDPNQLASVSVWQFFTSALPRVHASPSDQYKDTGQTAVFTAIFDSQYPLVDSIWSKDGVDLDPEDPDIDVAIDSLGGNQYSSTLTISQAKLANDGAYACIGQNAYGVSESTKPAYLVIRRLLAHWDFNGTVQDQTGTYDGTLYGEANYGNDGTRHYLEFDGTSNYVQLPDGFENFRAGVTVAMWVNPATAGNYARFLDLGNGAPSDNLIFTRAGTTSWLHFESFNGTTSGGFISLGSGTLTENNWQFFAVTVNEAGQAVLYKNGAPIVSGATFAKPNVILRTDNFIGSSSWTDYARYNGAIDDLKIYNYGLSEDAVAQLYADVAGDFCRFRPIYDFDGNCIVDLSDFAVLAADWLQCGIHPHTMCP